jgi:hypothetical protein
VVAPTKEDFKPWDGWVHSRLRTLVGRIEDFVTVRCGGGGCVACEWARACRVGVRKKKGQHVIMTWPSRLVDFARPAPSNIPPPPPH